MNKFFSEWEKFGIDGVWNEQTLKAKISGIAKSMKEKIQNW